jgi:hypothetical protein
VRLVSRLLCRSERMRASSCSFSRCRASAIFARESGVHKQQDGEGEGCRERERERWLRGGGWLREGGRWLSKRARGKRVGWEDSLVQRQFAHCHRLVRKDNPKSNASKERTTAKEMPVFLSLSRSLSLSPQEHTHKRCRPFKVGVRKKWPTSLAKPDPT